MAYMIVVATDDEYNLISPLLEDEIIVKTGVGAVNTVRILSRYDRSTPIVKIGYVGSNTIPIGTLVRIGKVSEYHPNAKYKCKAYRLDGDIRCYTSSDFVVSTDRKKPCVFDMELVHILAMGFTNVAAFGIVSDNLSVKEYEKNSKG